MKPLLVASQLEIWAGKNIAHNLTFVPADKMAWKAGPDAKSALEIVSEVVFATLQIGGNLGATLTPTDPATIVDAATATAAVLQVTEEYAAFMANVTPEEMEGEVSMGTFSLPRTQVLTIPLLEAIHHHGQIAFLQTLWGDKESHFFEMGS